MTDENSTVIEIDVVQGKHGVAYFDAMDVCQAYKVSVAEHLSALESWKTKLGALKIHPELDAGGDTVWIPVVLLAAFLISVGAEEHTETKHSISSKTLMADLAEMPEEFVGFIRSQFLSIGEAMPKL
ncbi:hypothetical protein DT594_01750 [Halopseudomonas laoshanensis]|uniref:Uncharacterized protein n=1 Tax=Halopseudomonas laoshanensis TaxID=2268758 RepID=A0A7V7GW74_9GAMM|nr:hypothetical protein [Halopseudomonas laoshanensis]KAA0696109.1 hypothetical protein DT594_01750 [Halopseudomonas laoshanensis]